jgi:hypothetical protein
MDYGHMLRGLERAGHDTSQMKRPADTQRAAHADYLRLAAEHEAMTEEERRAQREHAKQVSASTLSVQALAEEINWAIDVALHPLAQRLTAVEKSLPKPRVRVPSGRHVL